MIAHLAVSLLLAVASITVLVRGLQFRPATPLWSTFVVFFFVIWAGGVWMAPIGPRHFGVVWLPFALVAIMLSILVVALMPHRAGTAQIAETEREIQSGLGLFFFVLVAGLIVAIVAAY
jgi:hypothetical protein